MAADLVGEWSWTVWLLIPLVLALAFVTAMTLGSSGEPRRAAGGSRGVSAHLARSESSNDSSKVESR